MVMVEKNPGLGLKNPDMVLCYWFAGLFPQQQPISLAHLVDKPGGLSLPVHLLGDQEQQTQLSAGLCIAELAA